MLPIERVKTIIFVILCLMFVLSRSQVTRLAFNKLKCTHLRPSHSSKGPQKPLIRSKKFVKQQKLKIRDIYPTKPVIVLRKLSTNSSGFSWDTFHQASLKLHEKIEKIAKESGGSLNRALAEELVDEIMNLRRENPSRRDSLLKSEDAIEMEDTMDEGLNTGVKVQDPLIERYESLLILAKKSNDLRLVMLLYDEILQRDAPITPTMLNIVLKCQLNAGDPTKAQFLLSQAENHSSGSKVAAVDFTTLYYAMKIHLALGDETGMTRIYKRTGEMVEDHETLPGDVVQRIVASYIVGLAEIGFFKKSILIYEQIEKQNSDVVHIPFILNSMIETYSNEHLFAKVLTTFERLTTRDARIPYELVSRAIVAALVEKKTDMAKKLFSILEESREEAGESSTNISYADFVKLSSNPASIPRTHLSSEDTTLIDLLNEQPSKENYEKAIEHFSTSGHLVLADELFQDYRVKYCGTTPPSTKMIGAMFQGAARLNNGKYLPLVVDFEQHRIPPSLARSVINFYIDRGDAAHATEIFFKILTRFPAVIDGEMCENVMHLFEESSKRNSELGARTFTQIIETFPLDVLDVEFFNRALSFFTNIEHGKGIAKSLEEIKKRKLVPNTVTYTCLMHIYIKKGEYKQVLSTYLDILKHELAPDVQAIMALITALGETKALAQPKSVTFVQEQLDENDIEPEMELFEVLKKAATLAGNPNAYGAIMRSMATKHQVELNAGNYFSWLSALLQCGQLIRGLELAKTVLKESKRNANLISYEFCAQLALAVSKEAGSDFNQETIDRWADNKFFSQTTLGPKERAIFAKDVAYWASMIKDEPILGM